MADPIKLSVVSQEGTAFERNVNYVNIPTPFGSVGVLSGHAPMLCAVAAGLLRWGRRPAPAGRGHRQRGEQRGDPAGGLCGRGRGISTD